MYYDQDLINDGWAEVAEDQQAEFAAYLKLWADGRHVESADPEDAEWLYEMGTGYIANGSSNVYIEDPNTGKTRTVEEIG